MAKDKRNNFFSRLRTAYRIAIGPPQTGGIQRGLNKKDVPQPGKQSPKDKDKTQPLKLPDHLQKLWDYFLKETSDTPDTLKNRIDRYNDLDYAYYNNAVISMAIDLYADETVQSDNGNDVLGVVAESRKVEKYIMQFFEKIGVTVEVLKTCAHDLSHYGDHFWIQASNMDEGFTEVIPLDVYSVKDRIEFNAIDANKGFAGNKRAYTNLVSRDAKLKALTDILKGKADNTDYSAYFRPYLFGFQIEDQFLPPWNVSHFRRFTTKSEFAPFGRPLLINSIGPFRILQASKNLMAMARAARFPKEHYEVETDESMTETEKWQAVNEAREEFQNLGIDQSGKEEVAVGGSIWTPKGLLDFNLIENRMNLDDIADIEMLRDDLIISTRVPKGYLIVDRASFGTSGQALLQQFKPFGRAVYTNQTSMLNELAQMVRLQFIMTGDFPEDTEFELTMPFPVIEESQDRIRIKSDTLRLANDVISNIQSALGLSREALPADVVKDIFSTLTFLEPEDVETWIDSTDQSLKGEANSSEKAQEIREKIKGRLNEEVLRKSYFEAKRKLDMKEGIMHNKHYVTSRKINPSERMLMDIMKKAKGGHLKEKVSTE